ncbi:hypothetical protein Zmor_010056 [Zophobas morio]|uniref:UDP-glucuronosyltransferase n=1 Tax=Zophobas morio TaxID=2755281 RepID=A0AA38MIK1_9CUCU|nr:hypothetical protein Zmor_010056 [Zophobas morio]
MSILEKVLVLTVLIGVPVVYSFKILVFNPFPAKSHSLPFLKITEGLIKKGHQVTSVGHFPLETTTNYTHVQLRKPDTLYVNFYDLKSFSGSRSQKWFSMKMVNAYAKSLCEKDFASDSVRSFLNEMNNFDVMVTLVMTNDCFLSLMHKYKVPVVGISTLAMPTWTAEKFGNPSNPSLMPNIVLDHVNPMGFWARMENLLVGVYQILFYDFFVVSIGEKTAREYFGRDLPSLRSIAFNVSLLLENTYFTYYSPLPWVPAIVEMGGIQTGKIHKLPNV